MFKVGKQRANFFVGFDKVNSQVLKRSE